MLLLPPRRRSAAMLALRVLLMQLVAPGAAIEAIVEQIRAARMSMCRSLCAKNPSVCDGLNLHGSSDDGSTERMR